LARRTGDARLVLALSNNAAQLALTTGDHPRAREPLEDNLVVAARLNDSWGRAHALELLGFTLLAIDEPSSAAGCFLDGLGPQMSFRSSGPTVWTAWLRWR
jgi:hypothetical protein